MRSIAWVLAVVGLLAATPGRAEVITGGYTAVVTQQGGDVQAIFGVASILGDAITGSYSYDTSAFGTSGDCGAGCAQWDSTTGTLPNGSITMSQTLAGLTFTVNGLYYNGLLLGNSNVPGNWAYGANSSGWTQTLQMWSEQNTSFATVDAITINIGRTDQALTLVDPGLTPGGAINLAAAANQSNGSNWATAAGAASWNFTIDTTPVPEPGSLALLATSLALLPRRRRQQQG